MNRQDNVINRIRVTLLLLTLATIVIVGGVSIYEFYATKNTITRATESFTEKILFETNSEELSRFIRRAKDEMYDEITNVVVYMLIIYMSVIFIITVIDLVATRNIHRHLNSYVKKIMRETVEKEKAQQENRDKNEFLSRMSHEMRTPLHTINMSVEEAADSLGDEELLKKQLDDIKISSETLLSMVNDILDISKIEQGKLTLCSEPFSVINMIKRIEKVYDNYASQKGLKFETEYNIEHDLVVSDETRITQVIVNLISNSIKFTEKGGTVKFKASGRVEKDSNKSLERFEFEVSDTGIGISDEAKKKIFNRFEQGDLEGTNKYEGTGLGLAISSEIASILNGDLNVSSSLGEGSTFVFKVFLNCFNGIIEDREKNRHALTESAKRVTFENMKILLAEDHEINATIVKRLLEKKGAKVDIAKDGGQAVEMFMKEEYALILMDIMMPVMGGYEASDIIRSSSKHDALTVPIVALSANAYKDDIEESKKHKMNGHIGKPVNRDELYIKIEEILKSHALT